jgi:hypothetical protein
MSDKNFEDILVRAALRGAENIFKIEGDHKPKRVVMSLQLLKLLGHEIASSNWEEDSKRIMWTACSVAFFGALRLGEMLCHSETSFDPTSTLVWDDVKFIDHDTVLIHLKLPKSNAEHGEFIDLFPFPGCCPVAALKGLRESNKKRGGGGSDVHVQVWQIANSVKIHKRSQMPAPETCGRESPTNLCSFL